MNRSYRYLFSALFLEASLLAGIECGSHAESSERSGEHYGHKALPKFGRYHGVMLRSLIFTINCADLISVGQQAKI
ncbi:hypothetical protein MTYP_00311 [Methylophilaceae bacterium]|nr:hypothetical protein MTYP_00311 [Methylophilaceae bacterium]